MREKSIMEMGAEMVAADQEQQPIRSEAEEKEIERIEGDPEGLTPAEVFKRAMSAETAPGEVDDFIDHPLNLFHSRHLAQMLRGFEGIFGTLRLAIFDVIVGGIGLAKELRAGGAAV